jgi:hypothetical protein
MRIAPDCFLFYDQGYPGLKTIDPAYALPVDIVDRVFYGQKKQPPVS